MILIIKIIVQLKICYFWVTNQHTKRWKYENWANEEIARIEAATDSEEKG